MDVANQPTPPPGASLEGVGRGQFTGVLLSLTMRPRKKLISINNGLILILFLIDHNHPQNNGITSPKQSTLVKPPLLYCLLHARLFLVGCCVYPHQLAAILGLGVIHFILLFCCPNCHPNNGTMSLHMLQPLQALSPTSHLPLL
jgi:hypothetical protein